MNNVYLALLMVLLAFCQCSGDENKVDINNSTGPDVVVKNELDSNLVAVNPTISIFESAASSYKIMFPGKPEHITEYVPMEEGDINVSMDTYSPNDSIIYAVKFDEFPLSFFEDIDEEFKGEVVQNALETTKENYGLDTQVFYEERIDSNMLGCYYQGHNNKLFVTCLYTLNANKLYQVVLTSEGNFLSKKVIDEFFNSFEIVNS